MHELVTWLREVLNRQGDGTRARVEAERAILDLHTPRGVQGGPPYRWTCVVCDHAPVRWEAYLNYPCPTLRWLAHGHRFDAPGYDPAWAPDGVTSST